MVNVKPAHHRGASSFSKCEVKLSELLSNPVTAEVVKDVATKQMCVEQVLFLMATEDFRNTPDAERHEKGQYIYETFLKEDSPLEVNIGPLR